MEEIREIIARMVYPEIFTKKANLEVDLINLQGEYTKATGGNLPDPEVVCEISSSEVSKLLSSQIDGRVYILDRNFKVPTVESWKAFLEADDTNKLEYLKEGHDCDNFGVKLALRSKDWLPGCSSGFIFDLDHAWTFVVLLDKDGKLVVENIEPQTDGTPEGIENIRLAMMW